MTISSTTNRVSYAGDDSTTAFSFPHRFLADADLLVILVNDSTGVETTQTLTTDYTVSGAGDAGGGTVTMVTAPATGETLVIINDPALTQGYDPEDGSALGADSFETAFDRLTLIAQRTRILGNRSFRFSDGVTSSASLELPSPVALRLFRWNTDADAIELVQVSDIGDLAALADNEVMAKVPGSDADGIAIGEKEFLGRLAGGDIKALTAEETRRVLDDPEHATDSATDTYVSATNTTPPADGVKITRDFQSANTTTTPTLDGKTMTTRDGSALWPGAVSGVHDVQYASGTDTYLVLEPRWQLAPFWAGHIDGLELSNGTDSDHDIDIATGVCSMRDGSGNRKLFDLTSSLTKQIDANWAEGTDSGGFPSGLTLSAGTTYHVFLIGKDDGSVDAGFDTSLTASSLLTDASSYSWFRRIGSLYTDGSSNWIAFSQNADGFVLDNPTNDYSVSDPGTSATLRPLSVPSGIQVLVDHSIRLRDETPAGTVSCIVTSPDAPDTSPDPAVATLSTASGSSDSTSAAVSFWRTDTSGQIRTHLSGSNADISINGTTFGWIDDRGRNQ